MVEGLSGNSEVLFKTELKCSAVQEGLEPVLWSRKNSGSTASTSSELVPETKMKTQ